ncbi:uncharacterized protein ACLA_027890 [Aspergillus clavatus NRRL 1]|uniref:Uncharacterized protein n=1 Tax=Aspergillus clavatus (strain ATCC 1007 / CBS 513.65 / DSM 816 / NCTC 3887 / NRRL 1 / QM 1276 / 107) TaxID=344612 RepID=A1CQZ3_ASPCL|nr:uncharacterized protein ACLA_027890 [Aspergillus clavatus NRRL 1]EAW08064.1 conserved hypothetical protein [Aspergillus clavatus NRRL 1]
MVSPDLDLDVAPIPRSREENQERAFIAASRRKDRSLDARLESANRASMLHKKRTGKALLITKEIVEREAMYEEVDERYQEKRIRMLQAQNMQIEEQLNRQLLAALAVRSNGIQQRRAANTNIRGPMDGVRKMSLDLSSLRSSFSEGTSTGAMTSPMVMDQTYMLSPSYDGSSQSSYLASDGSYPEVVPASSSAHVPSYVAQHTPTWPNPAVGAQRVRPSWAGFNPQQYPEQLQRHSQFWGGAPVQQFRDRLASAPEISMHGLPAAVPSSTPATNPTLAATPGSTSHHIRVRSESSQQPLSLAGFSLSGSSSPKMFSTESLSTPDLCPTPSTPHSPTSTGQEGNALDLESLNKEPEVAFSQDELDPDYDEFSRFAWGLGSNGPMQDRETLGFDDYVALDEFAAPA